MMDHHHIEPFELKLSLPFGSSETAQLVHDVLVIDKELKGNLLRKALAVNDTILTVHYYSADLKLMRVAVNSFLKNISLVVKTISLLE